MRNPFRYFNSSPEVIRRREGSMSKFKGVKTLQKFSSVYASSTITSTLIVTPTAVKLSSRTA